MAEKGLLIVLSAPSGCGKSTIIQQVMARRDNLRFSVSATTRAPREGEKDGREYFFKTREEFMAMVERGELLEWAEYVGNCYGTPRSAVEEFRSAGYDVILDIETVGAAKVLANCPDAVSVFILPPSLEELRRRLLNRGTDTADVIDRRVEKAREECTRAVNYRYQIVNDDLDRAVNDFIYIIDTERART